MEQIKEHAYAKINLGLDVTGRRDDGYHLVSMVMQQIEIHDDITIYKTQDPAISLEVDFGGVHMAEPLDMGEKNLCVKAAHIINGVIGAGHGYFIHLTKRIPIAAGMAGGSSDAAAVLRGINRLENAGLPNETLRELALKIGADVPYCIEGGTMLAEGIGEELTQLPFPGSYDVLVAKPPQGSSTKEIYSRFDSLKEPYHPDIKALTDAIRKGDRSGVIANLGNALSSVTKELLPQISRIEDIMAENGAEKALMTGSGPTVFGIFDDRGLMEKAAEMLRASGLCETVAITCFKGWDNGRS